LKISIPYLFSVIQSFSEPSADGRHARFNGFADSGNAGSDDTLSG